MEAAPSSSTCACSHLVTMPYPARGYINPMMNFCKMLLSNDNTRLILVTFVVTEEWLGFIGSDPKPDIMRFATIPNVVPSDHPGFLEAVMAKMEASFEELLNRLQPPPTAIVSDTFLYWAVVVGSRRNIPVALFSTMSASIFFVLHHHHLLVNLSENGGERVDYIPEISSMRVVDFPLNDGSCRSKQLLKTCLKGFAWVSKAQYLLFTSIYELEPHAIDVLKAELSLPIYTIGPAIPYFSLQNNPTFSTTNGTSDSYMEWLQKGVTWCDQQLRVLSHPSIGGFWSHCGWNSTKGVLAGVSFLTFPIIMDQQIDSKMIVEDWMVGWRVKEDVKVNTTTLVKKDEIAMLVQKFMDLDSNLAREIRERSETLRQICSRAITNGGSAVTDLNAFVKDLVQTIH
ncbi:hypothetical protein JHK87_040605 [Glycine soja]|nr:hypothetical protein JHK87_040605 [Glycine soja]